MNIWDFLVRNNSNNNIQFKKWLDVSSSHFSFSEHSDTSFKLARRIVRYSKELFKESGRELIFLSSSHHLITEDRQKIPLFFTPVRIEWCLIKRELSWTKVNSVYILNPNLSVIHIEFLEHELDNWIEVQKVFDPSKLVSDQVALYFDINHKAYIQRDLAQIQAKELTSSAIEDLFNNDIRSQNIKPRPDFLSLIHCLPMDYSQAKAINLAQNVSCHIAGPPGTGKSQTIINLALQEMIKGNRIAILSQKKVALEVLLQRFETLGLKNYILNLVHDSNRNDYYNSLEQVLEVLLNFESHEITESINTTYYRHSVRTIEDYFEARIDCQRQNKFTNIDVKFNDKLLSHPIFDIYFPSQKLLLLEPKVLIYELSLLQNFFRESLIPKDVSLDLVVSLEQPLQLISTLDFANLKKQIKRGKLPNVLKKLERERKLHIAAEPKKNELVKLSIEKLEYYLNFLISDKLISKLFNTKVKEIEYEVTLYIKNWKETKVWYKIEKVQQALNFIHWENQLIEMTERQRIAKQEIMSGLEVESLSYILSKLESKLPAWKFVQEVWLKEYKFQTSFWSHLIQQVKLLLDRNAELGSWTIDKLMDVDLNQPLTIDKSQWDQLCSLGFESMAKWKAFKRGDVDDLSRYPVLKNYSRREIVEMANYVRKHTSELNRYQLQIALEKWNQGKSNYLLDLLKSRKQDTKLKRDKWKNSIQFLQKKWSHKRTKPTLFQAFSNLDLDFLLWLKPLTISSLDKFSQYIPLASELYDVIIFDEASQIELVDSIPALLRAKRVIIVGDNQQLTPMKFFKYKNFSIEEPHESLLELAEEKLHVEQLNYQYRAKFRELIQYSNLNFYDNKLVITTASSAQAIKRVYLSDGLYHNRKNEIEAERIVNELMAHLMEYNDSKSIGIITFSIQQKETILARLDAELIKNKDLHELLKSKESSLEPFFVKSIEQVQGDERDLILISSSYGKNEQGKIYNFFGPILTHKGENRLNVLMSRAREKIVFITSLQSSDIKIDSKSGQGLYLLKELLLYIENPMVPKSQRKKTDKNYWEYLINPFRK